MSGQKCEIKKNFKTQSMHKVFQSTKMYVSIMSNYKYEAYSDTCLYQTGGFQMHSSMLILKELGK